MKMSRRTAMLTMGGACAATLATPFLSRKGWASETITVADPGGPYSVAYSEAFYRPFEQETGVTVANVSRDTEPVAQFRAMVEAKSYIWDVCTLAGPAYVSLRGQGLLHDMGLRTEDYPDFMEGAIQNDWMALDVYSTVSAFRTDRYADNRPTRLEDLWDVETFPGRRGMYQSPVWTLEQALMADGVAPADLYPLDLDRAFRKLDEIKPHITAWWTAGAQSAQLLQSAEVEFTQIFNARAQALIDENQPVEILWDKGIYGLEGWSIPNGSGKADIAVEFVKFCADPERQAIMTRQLAYGPTNLKAYDQIPEERAKVLPTYAENLSKMAATNEGWWFENRAQVVERFSEWVLL